MESSYINEKIKLRDIIYGIIQIFRNNNGDNSDISRKVQNIEGKQDSKYINFLEGFISNGEEKDKFKQPITGNVESKQIKQRKESNRIHTNKDDSSLEDREI